MSNLSFQEKLKLCKQIEKVSNDTICKIYDIIKENNPSIILTKTKRGVLLNFNKINMESMFKIIEIMENKDENNEEKEVVKSSSVFFREKKKVSDVDKNLMNYLYYSIKLNRENPSEDEDLLLYKKKTKKSSTRKIKKTEKKERKKYKNDKEEDKDDNDSIHSYFVNLQKERKQNNSEENEEELSCSENTEEYSSESSEELSESESSYYESDNYSVSTYNSSEFNLLSSEDE